MEQKYIVALEIGSSKIKGAVGVYDASNSLSVIAVEEERLTGDDLSGIVRYGLIQNVDKVAESVERIHRRLEASASVAPHTINSVYAAIGGRSIFATQVEISRQFDEETRITDEIVQQLKDKAREANPTDKEIIEVVPRSYTVDSTSTLTPVGMFGTSITASLMLVTCKASAIRNLYRAVEERADLQIRGTILRPIAMANLVLTDDEKRLGSMMVDFGAETVSVAIYKGGVMVYLAVLPIGSRNITRDLMVLGNNTEERADDLKRTAGNIEPIDPAKRQCNPDQLDTSNINEIVSARAGEIITNIIEQIKYAGLTAADLPSGIVVVGGGSKLKGFSAVFANQSKLKVRMGTHSGLIRIADSRIQPDDALDLLAILSEIVRNGNPEDCTDTPADNGYIDTDIDDPDWDDSNIEDDETSRVGSDIRGFHEGIRDRKRREAERREAEKRKARQKLEAERRRREREEEAERARRQGQFVYDGDEEPEGSDEGPTFRKPLFKFLGDKIKSLLSDEQVDDQYDE